MKRLLTLLAVSAVLLSGCSLYSSRSNDGEDQMHDFIEAYNEDSEAAYEDFLSNEFKETFSLEDFTVETSEGFLSTVTGFISYSSGVEVSVLSLDLGVEVSETFGEFVVESEDDEVLYPAKILWEKKNNSYHLHGIHTMNLVLGEEINELFESVQAGEELDNPLVIALDLGRVRKLNFTNFKYESQTREIFLDLALIDIDDAKRDAHILYTFEDGNWIGQLLENM